MDQEIALLRDLALLEPAQRAPLPHGAGSRFDRGVDIEIHRAPFHHHPALWGWPERDALAFGPGAPLAPGTDLLDLVRDEQVVLVMHDGRAQESYLHRVDDEAEGRMALTQYRPGCWVGILELLEAVFREGVLATNPAAAERLAEHLGGFRERRVVALGGFDRERHTQVSRIPFAWFFARLQRPEHAPLRAWLGDQLAAQRLFRARILALVDAHPMLRHLAASDREYLLQLGSLSQAIPWRRGTPCPVYQEAGAQPDRAALIFSGDARLYAAQAAQAASFSPYPDPSEARVAMPGDPNTGFLGRLGPGALVGDEDLVLPSDLVALAEDDAERPPSPRSFEPPPDRQTEVRLAPESLLLEFDWRGLRRTLADSWEHWLPTLRYVDRASERVSEARAELVMVSGPGLGDDVAWIARGLAYTLAMGRWTERPRAEPAGGEVWLVELDGVALGGAPPQQVGVDGLSLWQRAAAPVFEPVPPRRAPLIDYAQLANGAVQLTSVDLGTGSALVSAERQHAGLYVVRPEANCDAERLISVLRSRADARFVVVSRVGAMPPFITRGPAPPGAAPRPPLEQWMSCEGGTLLWVHDDPAAPFPEAFEFSPHVVQVDRVNARYRAAATQLSSFPSLKWRFGRARDDRRPPADGIVRILDDAEGAARVAADAWEPLTAGSSPWGRALRRLARAVVGRTVGLALGGGGVWGSAHFAVIEQLLGAVPGADGEAAHPFPIDYVCGTSFGALVGGLFAAGGLPAARAFARQESVAAGPLRTARGMLKSRMFRGTVLLSQVSTRPLQRMIDDVLRDLIDPAHNNLLCTEIPFFPVSTLVDRNRSFSPQHGSVGFGVRAAGSLPPFGPAMRRAQDLVTDGAFVENVPAEMVRHRGADFVICANVIGPPASPVSLELGRIPPVAMAFDATIGRMLTLYRGNLLSQWMIGESQGRLQADLRLDLRTPNVPVYAGWRTEELWAHFRAQLTAQHFRARVAELYGRPRSERGATRMVINLPEAGAQASAPRSGGASRPTGF